MTHSLVSAVFLIAGAVTIATGDDTPPFKITTKRDNDRVDVQAKKDKVVFSVHSPVGISSAVIERAGEKWPDAVVLRLKLNGLERFWATNGNTRIDASVSSQNKKVRIWTDETEDVPLDTGSPYWMEIRMISRDGQYTTAIPLEEGYFEMQLPKAFFERNPKSITVSWIDFYRN